MAMDTPPAVYCMVVDFSEHWAGGLAYVNNNQWYLYSIVNHNTEIGTLQKHLCKGDPIPAKGLFMVCMREGDSPCIPKAHPCKGSAKECALQY